jgi:hypothetical protein
MTSIKTIGHGSSTNVNDSLRVHYNGFFDANIYNTYTPNFANRVELHGPAQFDSITVITAHSTRDSSTKVPNTAWALHAIDSIAPQIIAGTGITSIKTGSSYTISLYQAPYIASLTNTTPTNYLGQTVTSVTVNWTLGGPAITNQTLTGASLILTDRTHTFSGTWTNDASWTLSITDGITPSSANTGITFYVQKFYGTTSDAVPTAADIHTGSSSWQTQSSGNRGLGSTSITGGKNYIFYAYPASWGYVQIYVNSFGSTWNTSTASITNAYGNIQNYTVYTSPTTIVGTITISASGI